MTVTDPGGTFTEEERSRRPSVFSALREIIADLAGPDPHLGLYGAFGYDLAFQFEPVRPRIRRDPAQRDLVLHLPDRVWVLDRKRETALCYSYDFETAAGSTRGLARSAGPGESGAAHNNDPEQGLVSAHALPDDPVPGAYAQVVAAGPGAICPR